MNREFYNDLSNKSLAGELFSKDTSEAILLSKDIEILPLVNAAFEVRKTYFCKNIFIHILNNAQNGFCPEDCHYCAQSKSSEVPIEEYPLKSDDEILAEAREAYESGAFRYCMVFAGREPTAKRIEHIARLVKEIKSKYPLEVCVSAGILDRDKAHILKNAGLDRVNHNLNTSQRHYAKICTTHTYSDRVNTLKACRQEALQLCSGVIIGMGESPSDIIEMAVTLREMAVESLPINYFMPLEGVALNKHPSLSPEFCLRVLCLFRFLNPKADIRVAAGREMYLREMEILALYPATSLFMDGYLNVRGKNRLKTLQMIKDAGFSIQSECPLDDLISKETADVNDISTAATIEKKGIKELRPQFR